MSIKKSLKRNSSKKNKISFKNRLLSKRIPKINIRKYLSQLMIPILFQIPNSEIESLPPLKENSFLFRGDSGNRGSKVCDFLEVDTYYRISPSKHLISSIYPDSKRLIWDGHQFYDLKNEKYVDNIPHWIGDLLSEDDILDIFWRPPKLNDWSQPQFYLFDIINNQEDTNSRLKKLQFIIENCHLMWKIINVPKNIKIIPDLVCPISLIESTEVFNFNVSYLFYKQELKKGADYILLRPTDGKYQAGKSLNLLIWKPQSEQIKTKTSED